MTPDQFAHIQWGKRVWIPDHYGIPRQAEEVVIEGQRYYATLVTFGTPATAKRWDFFATAQEAAEADISTNRNVCLSCTIR